MPPAQMRHEAYFLMRTTAECLGLKVDAVLSEPLGAYMKSLHRQWAAKHQDLIPHADEFPEVLRPTLNVDLGHGKFI